MNMVYGQDGGFSQDFRQVNLSGSSYILERRVRATRRSWAT